MSAFFYKFLQPVTPLLLHCLCVQPVYSLQSVNVRVSLADLQLMSRILVIVLTVLWPRDLSTRAAFKEIICGWVALTLFTASKNCRLDI